MKPPSSIPVFLLLGPEEGEKDRFISSQIDSLRSRLGEDPEIYRFYPFESNLLDIFALLRNGSLFAKHKVVILSNVEEISKSGDLSLLTEYARNPSPEGTLFLRSTEINSVSQRIQKAVPPSNKKIFWEMFENRKSDWVTAYFRNRDIRVDREAVGYLLEMVENNTRELDHECERLAQYLGTGAVITPDTIEKYCYHSKEENVFSLFERVASRDFTASHEVLTAILLSKESEASSVLAGILWQVRKLLRIKHLVRDNYPLEEILIILKLRSKKSQRIYLNANKNYSLEEVENLIRLAAEFDSRIRRASSELSGLLIHLFLYYAVIRGGRYPRLKDLFGLD